MPCTLFGLGFQNVTDTKNYEAAEKSVMQCLTQLGHIGAVWKDVLPENIYYKAMGKKHIW